MNQKAYLIEKDTLSDMANQVRRISETNKMYTPSEMVNALSKYDPNQQLTTETWILTLEDGSTITKDVCIL